MKIRNKGFFIAVWLALSLAGAAFAAAPVAQFIPNHVFVGGYDAGLATDDAAVFEFDAAGNFVRKILVQTGDDYIRGVAFGPDGNLYCTSVGAQKIIRIEPSLAQTDFATPAQGLDSPRGLAFGPQGRLYVANYFARSVLALDANGTVVASNSVAAGLYPSHLTFGPEGHLYVSIYRGGSEDEIQEWDADLRYIRTFGVGVFASDPANVVFGRDDVLYVTDGGANTVRRFDADGTPLTDLPATGLSYPYGAALGPDGHLYVLNYSSTNVSVLDLETGTTVRTLSHPDLRIPGGIAFAPFRFKALIKGTIVGASPAAAKLAEANSIVSVAPGSGTVLIQLTEQGRSTDFLSAFPNGGALVFHGNDTVSADGRTFITQGASVSKHAPGRAIGSVDVSIKGKPDANGYFVPKVLSGSLHLARPGVGTTATFTTSKRVP